MCCKNNIFNRIMFVIISSSVCKNIMSEYYSQFFLKELRKLINNPYY